MIHAYIGYRLVAVGQVRKPNDCCIPNRSFDRIFLVGPLYSPKLSVEAYSGRVTALSCSEVVLSTQIRHPDQQPQIVERSEGKG